MKDADHAQSKLDSDLDSYFAHNDDAANGEEKLEGEEKAEEKAEEVAEEVAEEEIQEAETEEKAE